MSLLFALPRLLLMAATAVAPSHDPSAATKLAMRSAYAWRVTAIERAIEGGNYPAARRYADEMELSPSAGWEAGYYGAKLNEGFSILDPHGGPLGPVHYSPNGRYIATPAAWSNNKQPGVCYLWEHAGHLVATLKDVRDLAFSPNSRYLLTTDLDGKKATVWAVDSGMPLKYIAIDGQSRLSAASDSQFLLRNYSTNGFTWVDYATTGAQHQIFIPRFFEVSSDGKHALNYTYGKAFSLLSTVTGQAEVELHVPKLPYNDYSYSHLAFSQDSSKFAASFDDGACVVWSVPSGKILYNSGNGWPARLLKFSPDASRLIVLRDDRALRVLDVSSGKELSSVYPPSNEGPYRGQVYVPQGVALSPDNKRLMCVNEKGLVSVWDYPVTPNRAHLHADRPTVLYWADDEVTDPDAVLMGHREQVTDAAFSPDLWSIASTSGDGTLMISPTKALDPVQQLRGHEWDVKGATFSPNGKLAVTVSQDDSAKVWDAETGRAIATLSGHKFAVNSAAFSHDGSRLVTCSQDGTAIVWSVATWSPLKTLRGHKYSVTSASFSPDDRHVLTASLDGTAAVWNAATGGREFELKGHKFAVNSAVYSKDGQWIVTASADSTAALWSAATGRRVHVLSGHKYPINAASFSNDCRWVVTASADGTAQIWSCATGSLVRTLDAHGLALTAAAFSPSGWQVVTGSKDGTATVWTVATGRQFVTLNGHEDAITSVSFSPDSQRILTSSEDSTARLWDAVTGRQMALLNGHLYGVNNAAFSADGRKIITASKDCSARIWYSYARVASR